MGFTRAREDSLFVVCSPSSVYLCVSRGYGGLERRIGPFLALGIQGNPRYG